jgi:hypothetical protein
MAPKHRVITVRIEEELGQAMEAKQALHGTPLSEQVRRALRAWLEAEGIMIKAERKQAATRKRS